MHDHAGAFHIFHLIIFFEYLIISTQFFVAFTSIPKHKRTIRESAQAYMVAIFIFCSILGYVSQIIYFWEPLHYTLLCLHICITAVFIIKNHARTILDGFKNDIT